MRWCCANSPPARPPDPLAASASCRTADTWVNGRWQACESLIDEVRTWLGDLAPEVARRIAWENGAALFGLPRTLAP